LSDMLPVAVGYVGARHDTLTSTALVKQFVSSDHFTVQEPSSWWQWVPPISPLTARSSVSAREVKWNYGASRRRCDTKALNLRTLR
jgi:hypothetical protein